MHERLKHGVVAPLTCPHGACSFTAFKKGDMTRHVRTHSGERPYHCDHEGCTFSSAQSGNLRTHKAKKHKE